LWKESGQNVSAGKFVFGLIYTETQTCRSAIPKLSPVG
jgi:hypothetical protein